MISVEEVIKKLNACADPDQLEGMEKYGIGISNRLGVKIPDIRRIAKEIGKDHRLALKLWKTGIAEAMILASMVDIPGEVTDAQMETWVLDFNSWDICDQVCMNLFNKTTFAWNKVVDWSRREEEFVKRASFALIACLAWHDKQAPDDRFVELLPVIERGAKDNRNYVRKAVSWALRNIGKRNQYLRSVVLETAQKIKGIDSSSTLWIASDVVRDLNSDATLRRLSLKEQ